LGGLARRASLIDEYRSLNRNIITVDGGNFFAKHGSMPQMRADVTMQALAFMQYDGVNIGKNEFRFGTEYLKQRVAEKSVPMLSSNVVFRDTQLPVGALYVIKRIDDLAVAIVGVLPDQTFSTFDNPGAFREMEIIDPETALKRVAAELPDSVDVVILLSQLHYEETVALVDKLDFIDVAFSGAPVKEENEVALTGEGAEGPVFPYDPQSLHIGYVELSLDDGGSPAITLARQIPIDRSFEADPRISALIEQGYKQEGRRQTREKAERIQREIHEQSKAMWKMSPMELMEQQNKQQ
jgi:2',3'-cyclic-nucleotide 2'-phosphodiesterase (5'-nucleotidase family)